MKFGKYLAARQLEFPEYSSHFINYKQLKKLINQLSKDDVNTLQDKKGSFFFRLERELEKVNEFYLEKESELRFRLDLLIDEKNHLINKNKIRNKNSITYISLYDGFKKFSKDLDRLQQYVELNETGFTKVLKKWDKRSKSSTKELYLTTAVNVQPIFHRNQIIELSDLVANNIAELESIADGEKRYMIYENDINMDTQDIKEKPEDSRNVSKKKSVNNYYDQIYTDFYEITLQNANLPTDEQTIKLNEWSNQIISKLNTDDKKYTFSKVFMLLIGNSHVLNDSLLQFYEIFNEFIDLNFVDELNYRNCLINAAISGRSEIIQVCLNSNINPSLKDITGKNCLHYLTENGRDDLLISVLSYIKENSIDHLEEIVNLKDNDSTTPLLLAIINNHISTIKILLEFNANGFPKQNDLKPTYLPLNVACKFGNFEVVELLLLQFGNCELAKQQNLLTDSKQSTAEGLLPLHIVASSGNVRLVPLLLNYGADINQLDKLNKWPAIFYSVFSDDCEMTRTLIHHGADFTLKDEDGFDPLYYAIWEGNVSVSNILLESMRNRRKNEPVEACLSEMEKKQSSIKNMSNPVSTVDSISLKPFNPIIDFSDMDLIPELSLPPPIIPLRKYGHNFLEKRIFFKISFYTNRYSINLNPDIFLTSAPGRITINNDDLIPKNIKFPVLDNEKVITFQLDAIDDDSFKFDFELFPTFGTRLIAKATLTSSILRSQFPGLGSKNAGDLELPLLDYRLRNIGSLRFNYEVIYPFSGIPLEISMYDTYWKLSSSTEEESNAALINEKKHNEISYSFVTSSSLNGEYYGIHICLLNDGTPVVCPNFYVEVGQNVSLPISLFKYDQLSSLVYKNSTEAIFEVKHKLQNLHTEDLKKEFSSLMAGVYLPLHEFLGLIDKSISLNLEIFYPSTYELENFDMKEFAFISNLNLKGDTPSHFDNNLNYFMDSILNDVFTHVRKLRTESPHQSRQFVLSSNNPSVCTILNWKQPNYPVFYNMNGIRYNKLSKQFFECSANGILKRDNSQNKIKNQEEIDKNISIDNIDSINKDSTEYINSLDYEDKLTRSLKLAINYAVSNNLLGITVSEKVLKLSPEIAKSIRSKGLILVASKDDGDEYLLTSLSSKANSAQIDDDIKMLENEGEIHANGSRFRDILTFIDAVQM